jgi:glutathione synthase/RimK-type ligase-like ATP-grasp enzyme
VVVRSKYWLKALKNNDKLPFSYPFIIKTIDGSMGEDNYLVTNDSELKGVVSKHKDVLFIAQEFIPDEFDYRVIVVDGDPKLVIKRARTNPDTHLNNTSQGAEGTIIPIEQMHKEVLDMAVAAAVAVRRPYFCGVDIIQNTETKEHYVLEVNKTPQMETGSNTEHKVEILTDFFSKKLERIDEN